MKFLEDELEVSKNEIKTLHDTVNMQKVLINDYKDRLTESLKKMNEILVFADNKNMNEKTLKEKLKSSSQQYDYEITSANQKYKEENKRRLDIGRSLDNLKLFLNNILKNENKELNVKVPDDERELMLKVKYYIDSLKH